MALGLGSLLSDKVLVRGEVVEAGVPLVVVEELVRCEIHNAALLKQLIVNLLDGVDWMALPMDVKGTIYEELVRSGSGVEATLVASDQHVPGSAGVSPAQGGHP